MKAHDLRDLCPQCWKHPKLPEYDRCLPCHLVAEWLRLVAANDQLDAVAAAPVAWGSLEPYQQHPGSDGLWTGDGFAADSHYT